MTSCQRERALPATDIREARVLRLLPTTSTGAMVKGPSLRRSQSALTLAPTLSLPAARLRLRPNRPMNPPRSTGATLALALIAPG